jgi:hypothetical protein
MSHVSECIQLYRNDLFVTSDEFGRLIQDALERDDAEADAGEAPEPEPFTTPEAAADYLLSAIGEPEPKPFTLDAAAVGEAILRNGRRHTADIPPPPDPPAYVARLVLEQFEQLVSTVETNGEAIALLGTADTLRRETVEALTAAVEHLTQRMNLRAEECRALNRRIDNLAAHVGRIAEALA